MKWLLPLCLLSSLAYAEERQPFEIGLNPSLSYSSSEKFRFSSGIFFKVPVSNRFQIKLADESLIGNKGSNRFLAGIDYNFSEEWLSSFFAGLGAGWQRHGLLRTGLPGNYWFGYAEAGKRFTLVRSWGLSYAPQMQFSWGPDARTEVNVMPVNFSVMF